ncbi:hypothetical protein PtA15_4A756 [Puccinia triticina]|uniref:Uncharacterized protein n=1 Tax=Puccinia triticina TaxID=208348 RepID=A0ABY7CHB7_9BASI|nr:uncharacterized protein PtA15_4A756 [Puccinia triticina]WAQ84303.1 hypothetical protein PtA15_4A756 [Puccinia triticina]
MQERLMAEEEAATCPGASLVQRNRPQAVSPTDAGRRCAKASWVVHEVQVMSDRGDT